MKTLPAIILGLLLLAVGTGCERSADMIQQQANEAVQDKLDDEAPAATQWVSNSVSPRSTLEECITAYSNLGSYEDAARVQLRYTVDGENYQDEAPLSVAWQQGSGLGLRVYSVVAGPNDRRLHFRFKDVPGELQQQVVSRWIPAQVDFRWLLQDQLVAEALGAGLGGFPPQLDLLFGPEPLAGLIQSSRLSFDHPVELDERACHVVNVLQGELAYRLYIDQATMLIRRLELPNERLPREILQNNHVSNASLSIDFRGIQTNHDIDWTAWSVELQPQDLAVSHFVVPPPDIPTEGIGQQVPAFQLSDATGDVLFDSRRSSEKAVVLMWLADHPICQAAASQLRSVALQIQELGIADQVRILPIWAEPQPPAGHTFDSLVNDWNLPAKLSIDQAAMGRDLFRISEAPSVVLLNDRNEIQLLEQKSNPVLDQILPDLIKRLCDGEDLADQLLQTASEQRVRFQAELVAARTTRSANLSSTPPLGAYAPVIADVTSTGTVSHRYRESPAIAGQVDAHQNLWLLHLDGTLARQRPQSQAKQDGPLHIRTQSKPPRGAPPKLLIDSTGEYVAIYSPGESTVEVVSSLNQSAQTARTQGSIIDCRWLNLRGEANPRLAVLSNGTQFTLLEPTKLDQLSGNCPSTAVAVLHSDDEAMGNRVVLANGKMEPLVIDSGESLPIQAMNSKAKLSFLPSTGDWLQCSQDQRTWRLASGWIAKDEPGLFLLDDQLDPQWHYRFPVQEQGTSRIQGSAAVDPVSGFPTWLVPDANQTLHLLRNDGLSDHFRLPGETLGCSLLADGSRLMLAIVRSRETEFFEVRWR